MDDQAGPLEGCGEGGKLGHYTLLRELGRGGQGSVFLARDVRLDRLVALKVLDSAADETYLARFRREAVAASRLEHPGICTVYEAAEADGRHYIAMRYVEGRTLASYIEQARGTSEMLDVPWLLDVFERTARTLHHAHEAGLVHRDVKPANIMITGQGPVLLDFGVSRIEDAAQALTRTGETPGTPLYMPPEVLLGKTPTRSSDIYSLGVTLYETLTLRVPFEAPTLDRLYRGILQEEPRDPRRLRSEIPRDLSVVVLTAMAKEPRHRYQTAASLAEELRRVASGDTISARPPGALERSLRWARREPRLATAVGGAVAALVVGLVVALVLLYRVDRSLETTRALGLASAARTVVGRDPALATLLAREGVRTEVREETVSALHLALARLHELRVLQAHTGPIRDLAVLPSGTFLSASDDGTVRIWTASGEPVRILRAHEGPVVQVEAAGSHGEVVLTRGSDGAACVWNVQGERTAQLRSVTAAALSADGGTIATGDADGTIRIVAPDGTLRLRMEGHEGAVRALRLSADGHALVSAGVDGYVRVWDSTGAERAALPCRFPLVDLACHFETDVILALDERGSVHIWDRRSGTVTKYASAAGVERLALAPDGTSFVVALGDGSLREHDLGLAVRNTWEGHDGPVLSMDWEGTGARIVTASADGTARVWSRRGDPAAVLGGHRGPVLAASFLPGGTAVVTGSEDATVRVWACEPGELWFARTSTTPTTASLGPQGAVLVGGADGRVRLWRSGDSEPVLLDGGGQQVHTAAFAPNGRLVLIASRAPEVRVFEPDGRCVTSLLHETHPVCARFAPGGDTIAVGCADGTVVLWSLAGDRVAHLEGGGKEGLHAVFSPNGGRVLTFGEDSPATLWTRAGERLGTIGDSPPGIRAAAFLDDGKRVALAADARILVCNVDGDVRSELLGHRGTVTALEPAPRGDRLLTASRDWTARIWTADGEPVATLPHGGAVTAARYSPSGRRIVTAARDGLARLWDADGRLLATFGGGHTPLVDACFSPDGTRILTASRDGVLRTWATDPGDLVALADRRIPRAFTAIERRRYAGLLSD